jgi:CheY-like chemotaxis protein
MAKVFIVVEDSLEQIDAVSELLTGEEFWIAKTLSEFKNLLRNHEEEDLAVMTDLFFPEGIEDFDDKNTRLNPLGAVVMATCRKEGIPCVIVTSQYHHSSELNWVCELGRTLGWPEMVDSTDMKKVGEKEPDERGYRAPIFSTIKAWDIGLKCLQRISGGA